MTQLLPNGADLQCRIAFASEPYAYPPTWTDVSADLISIKTKRGRARQLDRYEAGTATVVLKNFEDNYWENNTGGAYYPNVKLDKRLNIRVTDAGTLGYRTVGASTVNIVNTDIIMGSLFTPPADCSIHSLNVYTTLGFGTTDPLLKGAVYNATTLALVGTTAEVTPQSLTWNNLTFSADIHLQGGQA